MGTVGGGEVVSGITNSSGQFSAVFKSGLASGEVGVRAELLVQAGSGEQPIHADREVLHIETTHRYRVYLPVIVR